MIRRDFQLWAMVVVLAATPAIQAGDWPQILGPNRNGVAIDEELSPWSSTPPEVRWSCDLGEGYAGPAVADGKVVVFHRVGDVEVIEARKTQDGTLIWRREYPASYAGGVDPDRGPRCVPLLHDGNVYVFGAAGDLHAAKLDDGSAVWSRRTYREFSGLDGYFGAGSTPIVAGDRLLVNVGGRDGAGVVAFSLKDGATLWQKTAERASYSSPVLAEINGRPHVVFVTRLNTLVIDPRDGQVVYQFPFGQRGPTVNAATPLVFNNRLFVTASYGVGARLTRFANGQLLEEWSSDEVLSSQYPTPVYHEGHLYGIHGREDVGVAEVRCVEAKTGDICWSETGFGMAHLILASDRLLILRVDGKVMLAEASSERFNVLASAQVSSGVTRALPALADGRLYLRDNRRGGGKLLCVDLRP